MTSVEVLFVLIFTQPKWCSSVIGSTYVVYDDHRQQPVTGLELLSFSINHLGILVSNWCLFFINIIIIWWVLEFLFWRILIGIFYGNLVHFWNRLDNEHLCPMQLIDLDMLNIEYLFWYSTAPACGKHIQNSTRSNWWLSRTLIFLREWKY